MGFDSSFTVVQYIINEIYNRNHKYLYRYNYNLCVDARKVRIGIKKLKPSLSKVSAYLAERKIAPI